MNAATQNEVLPTAGNRTVIDQDSLQLNDHMVGKMSAGPRRKIRLNWRKRRQGRKKRKGRGKENNRSKELFSNHFLQKYFSKDSLFLKI